MEHRVRYSRLIDYGPKFFGVLILLFTLICVFDPADMVLGIKVETFVLLFAVTIFIWITKKDPIERFSVGVPASLITFIALFIGVPVLSIVWYYIINGAQPYAGFSMLKGYLLIALVPMLTLNRFDLVPQLSAILVVCAMVIIAVFTFLTIRPDMFLTLYPVAELTGIMFLDRRIFGENITILQVYLVTSPMLVMPIAYFFDRAMTVHLLVNNAG